MTFHLCASISSKQCRGPGILGRQGGINPTDYEDDKTKGLLEDLSQDGEDLLFVLGLLTLTPSRVAPPGPGGAAGALILACTKYNQGGKVAQYIHTICKVAQYINNIQGGNLTIPTKDFSADKPKCAMRTTHLSIHSLDGWTLIVWIPHNQNCLKGLKTHELPFDVIFFVQILIINISFEPLSKSRWHEVPPETISLHSHRCLKSSHVNKNSASHVSHSHELAPHSHSHCLTEISFLQSELAKSQAQAETHILTFSPCR